MQASLMRASPGRKQRRSSLTDLRPEAEQGLSAPVGVGALRQAPDVAGILTPGAASVRPNDTLATKIRQIQAHSLLLMRCLR